MSNPHKPSKRVLYLMGFAKHGRIFGNVWERVGRRHYSMRIIRPVRASYGQAERNPSQRELIHLLTFDLCELRDDPNHSVTNTITGKVCAQGKRVYLTRLGERLLREAECST